MAVGLLAAGCAPTFAPRIESPSLPALEPRQCAPSDAGKIAALEAAPELPDVDGTVACPVGSGLATCFTPAQEATRQRRFKLLHDDRDYCRDAYAKAVKRVFQR